MRYAYFSLAFLCLLTVSIMGLRGRRSTEAPIMVFPDMDFQGKYKPQRESKFFADGRTDRNPVAGTVPFGRDTERWDANGKTPLPDADFLKADDDMYAGKNADGTFARGFPVTVDQELLKRGQDRFQIYCQPCHGALGDGNGITRSYGMIATASYHDDRIRKMPEGEIFNTITHGKNTMMSYADKLSVHDRWAVIAYIRALERARNATLADVPAEHRGDLK
ncbi:MAG TPA: cytochrome c [Candidatus Didemnitutus sp.]|nr:cytochrome c [Candidatus Didemnitutus sp.]